MVRTRGQAPFITLYTANAAENHLSQKRAMLPLNKTRVNRNTFRQEYEKAGRKTGLQANHQDKKLYKESAKRHLSTQGTA
jgi:hypothetical protein